MAKRLAKYDVTYKSGVTRTKQLSEGDAERLGNAGATVKKRSAPPQDKKRSASDNKSAEKSKPSESGE